MGETGKEVMVLETYLARLPGRISMGPHGYRSPVQDTQDRGWWGSRKPLSPDLQCMMARLPDGQVGAPNMGTLTLSSSQGFYYWKVPP